MKPLDLTVDQAPQALAALLAVARADGDLVAPERELLEVHASLLGHEGALDALSALDLDALAAAITDPRHRAALVQRLVLMAMMDGEVQAAEIAEAKRIAARLGVLEPAIHQMEMFLAGRLRLLGFDVLRRSFVAKKLGSVYRERGLGGLLEVAKQARGKADPALAARYLALEVLPEGTVGRELFEHFRRSGFALPGEEGAAPEALLFHDLGHVLGGYATDPEGEVRIGGFEAGYMGEDGFSVTLLVLYLFHLGADINPTVKPTTGRFALEPFREAFARGAAMTEDLRYWDPWPHMDRPVADVQASLHIAAS